MSYRAANFVSKRGDGYKESPANALKLPKRFSLALQGGIAPAPAPVTGPPALPKASDALALTNSTLNQLQVCLASGSCGRGPYGMDFGIRLTPKRPDCLHCSCALA